MVLTDDFPPLDGGVATWTEAAARALVDAGDDVTVLARDRAGLGSDGVGGALPFEVVGVRGPSFGRRGAWWTAAAAWRRWQRVDRVLATTWPVARVVARWSGPPIDLVFHGSDLTRVEVGSRRAASMQRVATAARRRLVVSHYLGELLGRFGLTAAVLPSPVPVRSSRAVSAAPERWLYVCRATPLKGGDRFVRMVAAAGVQGTVVGDGPELGAWRALAASTGAAVRFTGRLDRQALTSLVAEHDLALLLPRAAANGAGAEGLGLVLLEAAAAGLAVVGCRTGGVPEAIGAGLTLDDPDDAAGSAAQILAWWTPGRGAACRAWLEGHHGPARLAAALRSGLG